MAQDSEAASGSRFISAFDRGDYFEPMIRERFTRVVPRPCERPSEGLRVCREGTEWELEERLVWNDRALYRLNDKTRAAIIMVPMQFLESLQLSREERDALMTRHVYELGARGPLQIEAVLSNTKDWCGAMSYQTSIVKDETGTRHLLHVYVWRAQYSTSFIEMTQELSPEIAATEVAGLERSAFFELLMPVFFLVDLNPYEERPPSSERRCKPVDQE